MSRSLLPLGAALVAITVAQAATISVEEILSNPDRFDGQMVTVEGTMIDLKRRVSYLGDSYYYKFYLSDGKLALRVTSLGSPPCQSGAVTVEGTFAKIKIGPRHTSYNTVSASRVICRQKKIQGARGEQDRAGSWGGAEELLSGGSSVRRGLRSLWRQDQALRPDLTTSARNAAFPWPRGAAQSRSSSHIRCVAARAPVVFSNLATPLNLSSAVACFRSGIDPAWVRSFQPTKHVDQRRPWRGGGFCVSPP